jgi:hypothetical protein
MSIFGDAWDWTKEAAGDIWGGVSGQTKYKATAYDPNLVKEAQAPWLGGLQQQAGSNVVSPYQAGLVSEASLNQNPLFDSQFKMANAIDPTRTQGQLEQVASGYGKDTLRQAAGLEGLSRELGTAPSYADSVTNARMSQGNAEAAARAASTRGANAGLQMRETAGANASANRQLIAEAAAMKAKEMADRYGQRGALLRDAASVTTAGAGTQGNLLGAAGQSNLAATQAKSGIYSDAGAGMREGNQLRQNALTQAGNLGVQQQQNQTQALTSGANTATAGQQIAAGSHDSTNATNAGVQTQNATNKGQAVGGLMSAAGGALMMMSDIRAKEDISPIPVTGSDDASRALRRYEVEQTPESFTGMRKAQVSPTQKADTANGLGAILGMLSDVRAKEDIDPIVRMALEPEENREALKPVKPSSYRYKASVADAIGQDTEPRVGVMTRDLKKSPAGSELVFKSGVGDLEAIDMPRAVSFNLAANAGLDKRLRLLEDALGRSRAA